MSMSTPREGLANIDERLPRAGELVADTYRIEGLIGRGGMGAVLAATHTGTGQRVALKWMLSDPRHNENARHRFSREAMAMARVKHPNVIDVYDVGEHEGTAFLVMELLEGDTLAALLKERGVLGARQTLDLLLPAMRGIEAAHEHHIVHRDLKPSNIFIGRDPNSGATVSRVVDFGISKVVAGADDMERSLTETGFVLGTPHYMAPEQLKGEPIDVRADIYALGVILYRSLAGRLPFRETNYNALVVQIATSSPPALSELRPHLPQKLSAAVMRAMAREREQRFQSVRELVAALEPFSGESLPVPSAAPRERSVRWWPFALAAIALASVMTAIIAR